MIIYVVTGHSESDDRYGPFLFAHKPTDADLRELIRKECDWCYGEDGPGDYGSWTFLDVTPTLLR